MNRNEKSYRPFVEVLESRYALAGSLWNQTIDTSHCVFAGKNCDNSFTTTSSAEAWGEAGRIAYPRAADIMYTRNIERLSSGIRGADRSALRKYFGSLVNRVTVYWGADPLNRWEFKGGAVNLPGEAASAQTYGYRIYIRAGRSELAPKDRLMLLAHELTHVQQYERYGSLSEFGYEYFKNYKKANENYADNKLEAEARRVADRAIKTVLTAYGNKVGRSVITIHNDTSFTVPITFWWDGENYKVKDRTLGPGERYYFATPGKGVQANIEFDASIKDGYQEKSYLLDPSYLKPGVKAGTKHGQLYRFTTNSNGKDFDLYRVG